MESVKKPNSGNVVEVNSLKVGTILKSRCYSYKILKVLGNGSFGITYLAEVITRDATSTNYSTNVTIKEFFMKDFNDRVGQDVTSGSNNFYFEKYLDKFIKESDKLSKINSEGVVRVFDGFRANGTAYYVMQYLSGGSMHDLVTNHGPLPEQIAISYAFQIAQSLQSLHSQKMLHLDLKPHNIMLSGAYDAVLIDFGLSKQYNENGDPESSTTIGGGTVGYAPIEQLHYQDGHGFPVTMDIYAFGATLFKLLSGITPPDASSVLNDGFPEDILQQAGVSPILIDFVRFLMAPTKKSRPQNIGEVIGALQVISKQIPPADKFEITAWIGNKVFTQDGIILSEGFSEFEFNLNEKTISLLEDRTEIHKPIQKEEKSATPLNINAATDKIEIKVNANLSKPHAHKWISITATPNSLSVIKAKKKASFAEKKEYFYSDSKFQKLKKRIDSCKLTSISAGDNAHRENHGVKITLSKQDNTYFSASSFEEAGTPILEGDISQLTRIVWEESGVISLDQVSSSDSAFGRFVNHIRKPKNWIAYLLITVLVFIIYSQINPTQKYLRKNLYLYSQAEWKETNLFQYAENSYNTRGIFYSPLKSWVLESKDIGTQHADTQDPNFNSRSEKISILSQVDNYAIIKDDNKTKVFFKDNKIFEEDSCNDAHIFFYKPGLYRLEMESYGSYPNKHFSAIYDELGTEIIPFSSDRKNIIGSDLIKTYDSDDNSSKCYHRNGEEITGFRFIVTYYEHQVAVEITIMVCISIICCLIYFLICRFFNRKRGI